MPDTKGAKGIERRTIRTNVGESRRLLHES